MANLPEWAKDHVTMEGWEYVDYWTQDPNVSLPVVRLSLADEHDVVVDHNGDAWLEGGYCSLPLDLGSFGPNRLPEAFHHAETIARAIQAAQLAAEVQGG